MMISLTFGYIIIKHGSPVYLTKNGHGCYKFVAKNPHACVWDESHISLDIYLEK